MAKIHTRVKKKTGLGTHLQHRHLLKLKLRKPRPKTFSSELSANAYAKSNNINNYTLKKVKKNKRFMIVKTID